MGLSSARPDIVESYRGSDYPRFVLEELCGELAASNYNEAGPTYAVEFKSASRNMREAKLQCAYDGALMTEGARCIHDYLNKSDDDFYGQTQSLTLAFNAENLRVYGHHALQISSSSQPASAVDSAAETTRQYPQYLLVNFPSRFLRRISKHI